MVYVLWILAQVISPIFALIYALALSSWRFPPRKTIAIAVVLVSALATLNIAAVKNMYPLVQEFPSIDLAYRLGNILLVTAIALFLIRQKVARTARLVFGGLSVCLCLLIVDTLAVTIRSAFGLYPLELLCELLLYPLMLLIVVKVRGLFLEVGIYMNVKLWPLCFVPLTLLAAILIQVSIPAPIEYAPEQIPSALMLCGISVAVYGALFYLFKIIRTQSNTEKNAAAMQIYTNSLERQNQIANQNAKMIDIFRHDLRHITQLMLASLDNGDADGIRELLLNIDNNVGITWRATHMKTFAGYGLIDSTLSHYIDYAEEAGIEIAVAVSRMDSVAVDKTELAVVLANAMENAVNACEKIPVDGRCAMRVNGHWRGKQYFLEIANTCAVKVLFDFKTGLPFCDREGHGYGTQSIAFFAQKYGVELEYAQIGDWFHLRMLLR